MKKCLAGCLCLLACLLSAGQVLAADELGNYAIWGVGQKSCFSFTKTRNNADDSAYRHYLMGYLTAYNTQAPETYRVSGGKNLAAILDWLDRYCGEKPVHGFEQAIAEFIMEHHNGRYRRARSAGGR